MKADGEQLHPFLISTPDGGVATLCPRRCASGGQKQGTCYVEGWVGPQSGGFGEEKIFPPAGIRTFFLFFQAVSYSV